MGGAAGTAGSSANADTAKDALLASGVPALSNLSEKGGPLVAAAAFDALLRVARGEPEP
jgi:precorrin-8X/cobalt-precorrin-8 methylmutase